MVPATPLGAILGEYGGGLYRGAGGAPLEPLQRRFEVIAQTNPAACAVKCNGTCLTYGELDAQADQLALFLQQGGLRPGGFCLLSLEPSLALVRAILAVLKAGAACLQFDPRLSHECAAAALEAFRPAILFTRRGALPWAGAGIRTVPCDEDAADLPFGWPDEIPVHAAMPVQALATASGRGLCLFVRTHGAVACRIEAMCGAGPPSALAFDLAGFLRPLSVGAPLNVAPPDSRC
ncbi:AMP-binding protein [Massilia cavernae]|nr:AMP-binding protein [Massilia cavernae]